MLVSIFYIQMKIIVKIQYLLSYTQFDSITQSANSIQIIILNTPPQIPILSVKTIHIWNILKIVLHAYFKLNLSTQN